MSEILFQSAIVSLAGNHFQNANFENILGNQKRLFPFK